MGEYFNDPATVTVKPGDTVRWVNVGTIAHNAVSGNDPSPDGAWSSPEVDPGGAWTRTFDSPGTYPYFCSLHPTLMPGTVVVAP